MRRREEIEECLGLVGGVRAVHLCDAFVLVAELRLLWAVEREYEELTRTARDQKGELLEMPALDAYHEEGNDG